MRKKQNSIAFYLVPGMRKSVQQFSHNTSKRKSGTLLDIDISVCMFSDSHCCVVFAWQNKGNLNILVWNCLKRKFYDGSWIHTLKTSQIQGQRITKIVIILEKQAIWPLSDLDVDMSCICQSDITKLPHENSIPKILKLLKLSTPQFDL